MRDFIPVHMAICSELNAQYEQDMLEGKDTTLSGSDSIDIDANDRGECAGRGELVVVARVFLSIDYVVRRVVGR